MQPNGFDDPHSDGFYVTSDVFAVDIDWLIPTLLATYWGAHRTRRQIEESIQHSLCFSLFEHVVREGGDVRRDRQVGFARVITDYATFSEMVDVIVEPALRKRGLGKFLVRTALNDPRLRGTVVNLGTRDAHSFYEALGFKRVEKMKRIPGAQTGA